PAPAPAETELAAPPLPPVWEQQPVASEAWESPPIAEEEVFVADATFAPGQPEELVPLEPPVSIEASLEPPPPVQNPIPGPRLIMPKKKPALIKEPVAPKEKAVQAKQDVMQFEPVTRGRFEKSEPTIVEGQDLDVPTYLRKNVRVK
ncbi:MAG TPA: hypothetical protein VGG94_08110, partial [Chthoniobacterales bacterium]